MGNDENTSAVLQEIREMPFHEMINGELPESVQRALTRYKKDIDIDDSVCAFQSFSG